jgi:hypothetical protein
MTGMTSLMSLSDLLPRRPFNKFPIIDISIIRVSTFSINNSSVKVIEMLQPKKYQTSILPAGKAIKAGIHKYFEHICGFLL